MQTDYEPFSLSSSWSQPVHASNPWLFGFKIQSCSFDFVPKPDFCKCLPVDGSTSLELGGLLDPKIYNLSFNRLLLSYPDSILKHPQNALTMGLDSLISI